MERPDRSQILTAAAVSLLVVTAWFCRQGWLFIGMPDLPRNMLRSLIYFGLFSAWGISLHRRIIQSAIRHSLIGTACLILLWMVLRTVKFHFVEDPDIARLFWYAYYIPLLLLPLASIYAAVCLGKPDDYEPPARMRLLFIPSAVLILLILTNDFHQLAFFFPAGSSTDGRHGAVYYLAAAWIVCLQFTALGLLLHKCRAPKNRTVIWLPFLVFAAGIAYGAAYNLRVPFVRVYFGDMTSVFCVITALIWESCIQCGLIRSNTRYETLFRCSTVAAQIVDEDYNVYLSSDAAALLPAETLRRTADGPVQTGGVRLSGAPVRGGHVIWQEDVSALTSLLQQLEGANEALQDKNLTLAEEYRTRSRRSRLAEQNHLFDRMHSQTEGQLRELSALLDGLERAEDPEALTPLLARLTVISAYLKRRSNLIFISEDQRELPVSELEYCLRESAQNLTLFGVACEYRLCLTGTLAFWQLLRLYEVFEQVTERALPRLRALYVCVESADGAPDMTLRLSCAAVPDGWNVPGLLAEEEDEGEWRLEYRLPEGGEPLCACSDG